MGIGESAEEKRRKIDEYIRRKSKKNAVLIGKGCHDKATPTPIPNKNVCGDDWSNVPFYRDPILNQAYERRLHQEKMRDEIVGDRHTEMTKIQTNVAYEVWNTSQIILRTPLIAEVSQIIIDHLGAPLQVNIWKKGKVTDQIKIRTNAEIHRLMDTSEGIELFEELIKVLKKREQP